MAGARVPQERPRDLTTLVAGELGESLPVGPDVAADMAGAVVTAAVGVRTARLAARSFVEAAPA